MYCDVWGTTHLAGPECTGPYPVTFAIPIGSSGSNAASQNNNGIVIVGNQNMPDPNFGGGGSMGGGTTSVPIMDDDENIIKKRDAVIEALKLHPGQKSWVNNNENNEDVKNIFKFLGENFFSNESTDFAKEAFEALREDGEVDWDEQIIKDESFKGTKAECIYEKLLNSSTGFKEMIQKFDGDFPVSHLRFINDPSMTSNTRKAYATPPSNYVIDITINGNSSKDASYQKRPNLLVAKTIIHEVIHAEIFRKLLSLSNNNGSINVSNLSNMLQNGDYPGILDYYARFGVNDFQHQQIAAHYREVIVEGLKEFDNSSNADQLYEDLAWEGLIYSNDPTWSSLSFSEKTRIKNVINNYINQYQNQSCQ